MTIIGLQDTNGFHDIQFQSHRRAVWMEGYVEVPVDLLEKVQATCGYCELIIENGALIDVIPMSRPQPPAEPTPEEINAQAIAELSMSYAQEMEQAQAAIMELSMLIGGTT